MGLAVWLCKRKANLSGPLGMVDHHWLKTDTYESGMGATPGEIPGQGNSDCPLTQTQTVDHQGQFWEDGAECTQVKDVDEDCADNKIKPGNLTGRWLPWNQCQSFASDVINACPVKKDESDGKSASTCQSSSSQGGKI
jgi:hypothetical protein